MGDPKAFLKPYSRLTLRVSREQNAKSFASRVYGAHMLDAVVRSHFVG